MGGRTTPKPQESRVDPSQQPFLQNVREQAQNLFQLGAPAAANVDKTIAASIAPVERRYTEQILPQITSAAEQAGAYGGSALPQVRGQAGRDFTGEAARIALTLRPQLEAAALQQQWGPLANYASILGAPTILGTGAQAAAPSTGASILSGALGGAGLGASIGSAMAPAGVAGMDALGGWMPLVLGAGAGALGGLL